jgi:hypothetical protein
VQVNATSRIVRPGIVAGGAVGPFFLVTDIVDAMTRPGYQPLRHWVSHLSLGPYGGIGAMILVATGVMLGAFAIAGYAVWARSPRPAYPVSIGIAGVALLAAAAFPIDPSLGFPPATADTGSPTLSGQIHDVAGPVFILSLAVAALTSRWFLRGVGAARPWTRWSGAAGGTVIAAFVLCSLLVSLDYAGVLPSAPSGLFERIAIDVGLLWTSLVAMAVRRHQKSAHVTSNRAAPAARIS